MSDDSKIHRVVALAKTCDVCPAQWEGVTDDGEEVYIRYRFGWLLALVGRECVAELPFGGEYGGMLDGADMARLLAPYLDFSAVLR